MLTAAGPLVVALGLGLDLLFGWLAVMHTYLYYFPLSLSLSQEFTAVVIIIIKGSATMADWSK